MFTHLSMFKKLCSFILLVQDLACSKICAFMFNCLKRLVDTVFILLLGFSASSFGIMGDLS